MNSRAEDILAVPTSSCNWWWRANVRRSASLRWLPWIHPSSGTCCPMANKSHPAFHSSKSSRMDVRPSPRKSFDDMWHGFGSGRYFLHPQLASSEPSWQFHLRPESSLSLIRRMKSSTDFCTFQDRRYRPSRTFRQLLLGNRFHSSSSLFQRLRLSRWHWEKIVRDHRSMLLQFVFPYLNLIGFSKFSMASAGCIKLYA